MLHTSRHLPRPEKKFWKHWTEMELDTTDLEIKSATLPHTPGRLSLKLPLKDREARTQFLATGTPSSPTSSTFSLLSEPMTVPFVHKNPSHAVEAFNSLNQMRANNEVRMNYSFKFSVNKSTWLQWLYSLYVYISVFWIMIPLDHLNWCRYCQDTRGQYQFL